MNFVPAELQARAQRMTPAELLLNISAVLISGTAALLFVQSLKTLRRFWREKHAMASIPDAPGGHWLLGHTLELLRAPKRNLAAWDLMEVWLRERGPIVKFRILFSYGVVTGDPQANKVIFQSKQRLYAKDLQLSYAPFLPILGTGLVTSDGELWQKQRLLIGPALRSEILDDIIRIAKVAVDTLGDKLEKVRGTGKVVLMEEEFRLLTLQVIGMAILSLPPDECDRVFPKLYLPVMEEGHKRVLRPYRAYLPTPDWFRYRWRIGQLNEFIINLARDRWRTRTAGKASGTSDILDRILDTIQESGEKWDSKLEQQLCYEIKTFLLAGHETSAAMLAWSLYELSEHPEQATKVEQEALIAFGSDGEMPYGRKEVDAMQYTLAVLKESLRKYSVVPTVTRRPIQDDTLLGHTIPKGIMVALNLSFTHNLWDSPTKFRPERFLPGNELDNFPEDVRNYMFVPFIVGPRNCLGQHLALLEARVVLARLVKRFKFTSILKDGNIRSPTIIPVGPVGGMPMLVE